PRARVTTTGIWPATAAKYVPSSGSCPEWPTYCQARAKIRSPSRRSTSGSAYHDHGSVRSTRELCLDGFHVRLDHGRVELGARAALQLGNRFGSRTRLAVRAVRGHRAEGIAAADDARGERDLLTAQPASRN